MAKTQKEAANLRFLLSCLDNSGGCKPDFQAVATELGIVSKAAAQKRFERLVKATREDIAKPPAVASDDAQAAPKTVKRKAPARAPRPSKKPKVTKNSKSAPDADDKAAVDKTEDERPIVKKADAESPPASVLSDAPASDDESI